MILSARTHEAVYRTRGYVMEIAIASLEPMSGVVPVAPQSSHVTTPVNVSPYIGYVTMIMTAETSVMNQAVTTRVPTRHSGEQG